MKEIIFEYDDTESYPNMTKRAVQFLKRETPKDNRIFLLQYVTMTSLLPPSKTAFSVGQLPIKHMDILAVYMCYLCSRFISNYRK